MHSHSSFTVTAILIFLITSTTAAGRENPPTLNTVNNIKAV